MYVIYKPKFVNILWETFIHNYALKKSIHFQVMSTDSTHITDVPTFTTIN